MKTVITFKANRPQTPTLYNVMISGAPNKHGIFHQRDLGVGGGEEEDTTRDKFLNSGDRQMDLLGFGKTSQCSGDGGSSTVPALGRLNEEED